MKLKLGKRSKEEKSSGIGGKAFAAARSARFIFFIGDEGTVLVYIKGNEVQRRQFFPDAGQQNLTEMRNALAQDPKAPVMLIIDTMDQSYIQQTLPPVSSLSVSRLIKRRLDRDFSPTHIKGAVILGRETTGRKDWNFMMVGIEDTPQITRWFDFLADVPNRFEGIYLVSVETEIIVNGLEHAMKLPKEDTQSEWKFFVSHNKVGGFRQVILRNGKIIFTRMAQPIGESTPEVIAGNIEQEILSTIEYMRRLSFNPSAGLDIFIVASSAVKTLVDKAKFGATHTHIMSPYEMAQYLGIEGATQPTDQFGDVVLAAVIGCSKRHILKMTTPQSQKVDQLHTIRNYQRMAAGAIGAGLVLYAGSIVYEISSTHFETSDLEKKQATQQQTFNKLQAEIKDSKLDVEKASDILALYNLLEEQKLSPVPFVARVQSVIRSPILVKSIEWAIDGVEPGVTTKAKAPINTSRKMTAVLTIEFPGVKSLEAFRTVSKKVLDDLAVVFPGYEMSFTKLPPVFSESERVDITFNTPTGADQALDVNLVIRGDALMSATPPPPPSQPIAQKGAP